MSLKTGSRWSNWAWDKPVKAFIWRSSRICRPIGGLPPWFFEDSLPHLLLRNNSKVEPLVESQRTKRLLAVEIIAHQGHVMRDQCGSMLSNPTFACGLLTVLFIMTILRHDVCGR